MDSRDYAPAMEQEYELRQEYKRAKDNLKEMFERLFREYEYFVYLRDQLTEVDIYGAEDFFGKPTNYEMPTNRTSTDCGDYIF